jgi:uncharacterized delta-60 repeat protein
MSTSAIRRRLFAAFLGSVLLLVPVVVPAVANAGQGSLDPSYGAEGWSLIPPSTVPKPGGGVRIGVGPEGEVFVEESSGQVVRLGPEGAVDQGFGDAGEISLEPDPVAEGVAARSFSPTDIAVDSQGRLLVFGGESDSRRTFNFNLVSGGIVTASSALVLRYDGAGQLDPTFGDGTGYVRGGLDLGVHTSAGKSSSPAETVVSALAGTVDSRDRPVLVAGGASVLSGCQGHAGVAFVPRAVVRLTASGGREPGFGKGGKTLVAGTSSVPTLGTDASGGVIADVGQSRRGYSRCRSETNLVGLGANGDRMAKFGEQGHLRLGPVGLGLVEPSGASIVYRYQGQKIDLTRIGASGGRSRGFGQHGLAALRLPPGAASRARPVGVDASGRILLAGSTGGRLSRLVIGRVLPDGRLDTGFGEGGWLTSPVPRSFEIGSITASLDPAGRLLVAAAGARSSESENSYLVARFLLG